MLPKIGIFGALLLSVSATPLFAQTEGHSSCSPFTGTWFGSFTMTMPDGKSMPDTAVIVFAGDCKSLAASAGPSISQQSPASHTEVSGDEVRFHLDVKGGLDFKLHRQGDHLVGAASGQIQAAIDVQPAPGLLPPDKILAEITEADRKLFEAFNTCNVEGYAAYLSPDLEFYHDKAGKSDYPFQLNSLRQHCDQGVILRRELVPDSLVISAAPGFGAIEAGTHKFYTKGKDGTERLAATARFTEVWSKASGSWKLVRVISYDHQ